MTDNKHWCVGLMTDLLTGCVRVGYEVLRQNRDMYCDSSGTG